jgi:hypothetical protein
MFFIDLPFNFSQSYGLSVILGLFTGTLITIPLLMGLRYLQSRKTGRPNWDDLGGFNGNTRSSFTSLLQTIGFGFLLGAIGIAWLYLWVLPVDLLLALDFRAFLPFLKALSPTRVLFVPFYFLLLLPVTLIDGLWIMGSLRTQPKETWWKAQAWWTGKAIFIKTIILVAILIVQTVASAILGGPFISGFIGFYLLFLWMFIPMYAVSTTFLAWSYRLTSRYYIAVIFNAFLFAWLMAAILPIYFI